MSVIDTMKEVAGLIQKMDNLDLMRRVVELQEQVFELVNENRTLKERLATREQVTFSKNAYWKGTDGPFCSRCLDGEGVLVRLHLQKGYKPHCPKCDTYAPDPEERVSFIG